MGGAIRRGRIRIRNKMGFQIVTILIFTIILPSIFFFWFIVQRYSNDLLSAAISERENLLEAINKSISLHFDNVQELSMTIYYDTSTKNYIDGHAYEEPSAAVEEALVTILNSRQSAESMALCFGGETYVYGKSFTNLQRYREQYEQQVLELASDERYARLLRTQAEGLCPCPRDQRAGWAGRRFLHVPVQRPSLEDPDESASDGGIEPLLSACAGRTHRHVGS